MTELKRNIPGWWAVAAIASIATLPGLSSSIEVIVFGEKFSYRYPEVQNRDIAETVLLLNFLALAGFLIGSVAVSLSRHQKNPIFRSEPIQPRVRLYLYLGLALVFGTLASFSFEGTVFTHAYSRGAVPLFGIGIYSVFAVFALGGAFASAMHLKVVAPLDASVAVSIALYVLVWCLVLRGSRLDAAGFVFSIFITMWIFAKLKAKLVLSIIGICAAIFMWRWGDFRAMLSCREAGILDMVFSPPGQFSCPSTVSEGAVKELIGPVGRMSNWPLFFSNVGDIALSQFQVVWALQQKLYELQLGRSYSDYAERLLPSILFKDRPVDFSVPDISLGGGSLHAFSEAFANFGLIGPFVLSILIGASVQWATTRFWVRRTFYSGLLFVLVMSLSFRGLWYQFFGVPKSLSYWALLECAIGLSAAALARTRSKRVLPAPPSPEPKS